MIAKAHAEGIVHRDQKHFSSAGAGGGTGNEWIGESQRQQQQQRNPERQQQQIAQTAMLDGALGAPLEEHQGAEGMRGAAILAQEMDPERQSNIRQSSPKPTPHQPPFPPPLPNPPTLPPTTLPPPL